MENVLVRKNGAQFYVDASEAADWAKLGYEVFQPMLYSLNLKEAEAVSTGETVPVANLNAIEVEGAPVQDLQTVEDPGHPVIAEDIPSTATPIEGSDFIVYQ